MAQQGSTGGVLGGLRDKVKLPAPIANLNETKKSLGCGCMLILTLIRSVAMLVIGAVYLNRCPVNKMVPLYLLVAGVMGLLAEGITAGTRYLQHSQKPVPSLLHISNAVLQAVQFIWFIVVYGMKDFHRYPPYCNRSVYLFAFWMITISLVLLCLSLFVVCCVAPCLVIFCKDKEAAAPDNAAGAAQPKADVTQA